MAGLSVLPASEASRYTVLWLHAVVRERTAAIGARLDRADPTGRRTAAFAAATARLEQWLTAAAGEIGESRSADDVRVLFSRPAGVLYEVHAASRTVIVTALWLTEP